MLILIIDDKIEEINNARALVEAAGHEALLCIGPWSISEGSPLPKEMKERVSAANNEYVGVWPLFNKPLDQKAFGKKVGILTDLMFPLTTGSGEQPSGLVVAAHAVANDIPVFICTDGAGNHHQGPCGMVYDGYYKAFGPFGEANAFGFNDEKYWKAGIAYLEEKNEQ